MEKEEEREREKVIKKKRKSLYRKPIYVLWLTSESTGSALQLVFISAELRLALAGGKSNNLPVHSTAQLLLSLSLH